MEARIRRLSGGLVEVVTFEFIETGIIQLIHQSVKEYFIATDETNPTPRIDPRQAQRYLARVCITAVTYPDFTACYKQSLTQFLEYATQHWPRHASLADVEGSRQLAAFNWPESMKFVAWPDAAEDLAWNQRRLSRLLPQYIPEILIGNISIAELESVRATAYPLAICLREGMTSDIEYFLQASASDVDYYFNSSQLDRKETLSKATAVAIATGHEQAVLHLIKHGADPDYKIDCSRLNLLALAAAYCRGSIIKLLLDNGTKPNSHCYHHMLIAIRVGSLATVKALIDNGADCNLRGTEELWVLRDDLTSGTHGSIRLVRNQSPLQHAILCMMHDGGRSEQLVHLLLDNGAKVKGLFPFPLFISSPQRLAKCSGLPEPKHGCGSLGETPLHIAAVGGYTGIMRRLIALGANVNALAYSVIHYGVTPLEAAAFHGQMAAVQLLLYHGADVASMGPEYNGSAVHAAAEGGHVGVLRQFLPLFAASVSSIVGEEHPLYLAAFYNHRDCITEIVKQGSFGVIFWNRCGQFYMAERHMKYFDWESWMGHTWVADPLTEGRKAAACALITVRRYRG